MAVWVLQVLTVLPTSETTHLILVLRARIRSPAAHPLPPSPRGSLLKWKFLLRRRQIGARCLIGRRKHRPRPRTARVSGQDAPHEMEGN